MKDFNSLSQLFPSDSNYFSIFFSLEFLSLNESAVLIRISGSTVR